MEFSVGTGQADLGEDSQAVLDFASSGTILAGVLKRLPPFSSGESHASASRSYRRLRDTAHHQR